MTPEILILGALLCVVVVLQLLALSRRQDSAALEQSLREEAREGRAELREQLEAAARQHDARQQEAARQLLDFSQRIEARLQQLREALAEDGRKARAESAQGQQQFAQSLGQHLTELTQRNEQRQAELRATVEQQLHHLQAVGDLKRVLSNVKNRGGWGEVQLDGILEQTLTQEQYARSVKLHPEGGEIVDFAVRLPGRGHDAVPVWLPIDAKFPREDYERLLDAQEQGDQDRVRSCGAQLERAIRVQAKSIRDKYIVPPYTTDFAVMFLATEGLYAETLRRPGLTDVLQREHRVVVAGPTTLTALLNSLQMGFRTLAIEQRSSEVWSLLGAVKGEFGKFAGILEKAEKQISTVGRSLGEASRKTRTLERRLRGVESLDPAQAQALLGEAGGGQEQASDEDGEAGEP